MTVVNLFIWHCPQI